MTNFSEEQLDAMLADRESDSVDRKESFLGTATATSMPSLAVSRIDVATPCRDGRVKEWPCAST